MNCQLSIRYNAVDESLTEPRRHRLLGVKSVPLCRSVTDDDIMHYMWSMRADRGCATRRSGSLSLSR